jgi:hypothetical protein
MCRPILVAGRAVEAHLIANRTLAMARDLVEACGGLVYWDPDQEQAHVVPARAPDLEEVGLLLEANDRWRPEFQMHQARLDYIWAASLRRLVDPRLMLAVLLHEGTGSFNTNPDNADQYNGHGPDANWIRDTDRAVSHVAGKLARYHQAVAAGFREAAGELGLEGTPIQFVGWPGPIWNHRPAWGCYAQHADWWKGVTWFYEQLGGSVRLLAGFWERGPVEVDQVQLRCEPVIDRPNLCSDLSGRHGRPGVVTWVV